MKKNTQKQITKIALIIFSPFILFASIFYIIMTWVMENDSIQEVIKRVKSDVIEIYKETFDNSGVYI